MRIAETRPSRGLRPIPARVFRSFPIAAISVEVICCGRADGVRARHVESLALFGAVPSNRLDLADFHVARMLNTQNHALFVLPINSKLRKRAPFFPLAAVEESGEKGS